MWFGLLCFLVCIWIYFKRFSSETVNFVPSSGPSGSQHPSSVLVAILDLKPCFVGSFFLRDGWNVLFIFDFIAANFNRQFFKELQNYSFTQLTKEFNKKTIFLAEKRYMVFFFLNA